ncbi:MAG TPA: methyltransferase domain-containing protein [Trebonia sp.]|jgi:2-polyprenyl-3-methyl-5-hydroxy-6-metoxy-1,4-benzoquinol methylase|nr:methyltransferase domain-containing protein [Trebonia sp.]
MELARYDDIADFYTDRFNSTDDSVSRALLELLGPVAGLRVLDIACGHGRITRELARRGANVTGVDISRNLISTAISTQRSQPLPIRYIHADVSAENALGNAVFDAATCNFGLSDIDDLDGAIATVSAAVRPGGRFAFAILHPCFPGDGDRISGAWPADGRYYDEGHWVAQGAHSTLRQQVGANHRMLSTYLNTLSAHDLLVERVAEPEPAAGWDQSHRADRMPVFFVARARRL